MSSLDQTVVSRRVSGPNRLSAAAVVKIFVLEARIRGRPPSREQHLAAARVHHEGPALAHRRKSLRVPPSAWSGHGGPRREPSRGREASVGAIGRAAPRAGSASATAPTSSAVIAPLRMLMIKGCSSSTTGWRKVAAWLAIPAYRSSSPRPAIIAPAMGRSSSSTAPTESRAPPGGSPARAGRQDRPRARRGRIHRRRLRDGRASGRSTCSR